MKLLSSKKDTLVFEFTTKEKELFLAAISFYPLLNPDYHRLSKTVDEKNAAEQQLLRDAMEEQRRDHKKQLEEFIDSIDWEGENGKKFQISLSTERIDWLLRVLNDVRVGAWDIVGRPNHEQRDKINLQSKNSHYYGVMELSGFFQTAFLHALERAS
ncbi:MAG: hypothetical protein JWM68_4134 [Verrucomicrobiales bacterium]|nr:hypothetical protein [Verrucomicrobiales bacterium]